MSLAASVNPVVVPLTSGDLGLGDAGVFYTCTDGTAGTPAPGVTGIVGPVSTTLDETKALLAVYNGGTQNIYPRFLRLHVYTIGTGGTRVHFTQAIDIGPQRWSSGGSSLTVNNTNTSQGANAALATVNFGALTLAAQTASRRFIGNTTFRATAIEVVEEKYQLSWGSAGQFDDPASLINNSTTLANVSYAYPPVVIAPGHNFVVHQWRASISTGITFGVEFGFVAK